MVPRSVSTNRACAFSGVAAKVRDVTHKEHAQLVSPVVETGFVYFDVQTQEVEPEFLCAFNIPSDGFVCEEGIYTFRTERLIEGTGAGK